MIAYIFTGDGTAEKVACELYWAYDEKKGFVYETEEVAARCGIAAAQVKELVSSCSAAYGPGCLCGLCGEPLLWFNSREDFAQKKKRLSEQASKIREGLVFLCATCGRKDFVNRANSENPVVDEETRRRMEGALLEAQYLSLSSLFLELLTGMASSSTLDAATENTPFNLAAARVALAVFKQRGLAALDEQKTGYWMLPELADLLSSNRKSVRPVFGSVLEMKAYYELKEKHLFVFPRVPLCAFVPRQRVKRLLREPWQRECYLTYTVDFVISRYDGVPTGVVELPGKMERPERQKFAGMMLERAGLPVGIYNGKESQQK